ncbi:hypothetical protein FRC00_002635 [Tulasnella sp. 408]|nr:hypothetical protein FRC00_002635 [Tulasnella sp. 408]
MLIFVLLEDGTTKMTAPGSIWDGAPTEWWPTGAMTSVPISFGLFMAGFSGHAVIPSIVRDMQDHTHYESMLNWAFFVATCIYGLIGAAGYRMFGQNVSPEVQILSFRTPHERHHRNPPRHRRILSGALAQQTSTAEGSSGHGPPAAAHGATDTETDAKDAYYSHGGITTDDENPHNAYISANNSRATRAQRERRKAVLRFFERSGLAVIVVIVAIYVPDFTTSMAFLGAFSAFLLCVIGPLAAKMAIERRVTWYDSLMIVVATIMAVWATYIAVTAA